MPIPKKTYLGRIKKIRSYLQENNQTALIVSNLDNFKYLTGFISLVGHAVERPFALTIPLDGDPFIVQCEINKPYYDYDLSSNRTWIKDSRYYLEHPSLTNRLPIVFQFPELFTSILQERGIKNGLVSVDSSLNSKITNLSPKIKFVSDDNLLRDMRLIKGIDELELMRNAAALSDVGQKLFMDELAIGKYDSEIGHDTSKALYKLGAEKYPDSLFNMRSIVMLSPYGMTGPPRSRKIKKNDVMINIISITMDGYMIENERTFVIGKPNSKQRKIFNIMENAQQAGLDATKIGNRICDIDSAAQKIIEDSGYGQYISHRTGHGQGLSSHEYPYDMAFNTLPLKSGMVFSCEPGIYIPGFGSFRHSDNMIVSSNSCEVISNFPKDIDSLTVI